MEKKELYPKQDNPVFSFKEIAEQIGVTEEEVIELAKREGLIDEHGMPTQKAIDEGLLTIEYERL
ncbi:hypothetical protein CLV62_1189 [Dysgonomonas alginatilytica]|uniref:Uncharacterized protein n=1 Tax=Dysgonomonas alginatilytica TaxID=1605892 RepID=A0A2V3PNE4_9BACT|nr:hypothetical protein [Dysgonomonas alginatilytica]PXV62622.1 hypothetical protein CLV62_1189 [Dysgonomonas alginatilytica]